MPRQQYIHAVDIVPTLYDLLGSRRPIPCSGHEQSPIEGESFAPSLTDASAPGKSTQFYAMLGQRSLYQDGWLACTLHPPLSGGESSTRTSGSSTTCSRPLSVPEPSGRTSRTSAVDDRPLVRASGDLQRTASGRSHGIWSRRWPSDRAAPRRVTSTSTTRTAPRFPNSPASSSAVGRTRSPLGSRVDSADAEGVLYAHGGVAGGHSLYIKDRRLHTPSTGSVPICKRSWLTVRSLRVVTCLLLSSLPKGRNEDPAMPGAVGTLTLFVDGQEVGSGRIVTQPGMFCAVGDGICVGRDDASPVTPDYVAPFAFTGGEIDKVVVDVSGDRYVDHEAQVRAWFLLD